MVEDPEPTQEASEPQPAPKPEYAPTPFDGPYFVPVLLAGMALWFGYDGFLNPERLDPEASLSNYLAFNQWGAALLALASGITGWRAWRREHAGGSEEPPP
ncbi:MAG: hypothetical protein CL910_01995 [Deltaproteobacteria bacterium]|jgi:hypothetical protein|nr:hypothetical protein [Deltaproteobacteria bacterium]